jgi:hypothetical protein
VGTRGVMLEWKPDASGVEQPYVVGYFNPDTALRRNSGEEQLWRTTSGHWILSRPERHMEYVSNPARAQEWLLANGYEDVAEEYFPEGPFAGNPGPDDNTHDACAMSHY